MPTLLCPHCKKPAAAGLHRFLPLTRLAKEAFRCNVCGEVSEFPSTAMNWSIAAGTAGLVATLLTLRLVMGAMGTNHIPMSTLGAVASFIVLLFTYQLPAALMLRQKAVLLPAPSNGS
jgi:hypothetical protein